MAWSKGNHKALLIGNESAEVSRSSWNTTGSSLVCLCMKSWQTKISEESEESQCKSIMSEDQLQQSPSLTSKELQCQSTICFLLGILFPNIVCPHKRQLQLNVTCPFTCLLQQNNLSSESFQQKHHMTYFLLLLTFLWGFLFCFVLLWFFCLFVCLFY